MTPSQQCIDLIKHYEGLRLVAYLPTPNDVWTIGYGHTADVFKGQRITEAEATEFLKEDVDVFARGVTKSLGNAPTSQAQFDAMVSFAYNIGLGHFKTSSVLARHKERHYQEAANAFRLWNKQAGRVLDGLTERRESERKLYLL